MVTEYKLSYKFFNPHRKHLFYIKLLLVWNTAAWKVRNITSKFHTFTIFDTNVILNWMWGETSFHMTPVCILNFQVNAYTVYKTCSISCMIRSPSYLTWLISRKLFCDSCVSTVNHSQAIYGYIKKCHI
jgi:hypothetical protein